MEKQIDSLHIDDILNFTVWELFNQGLFTCSDKYLYCKKKKMSVLSPG